MLFVAGSVFTSRAVPSQSPPIRFRSGQVIVQHAIKIDVSAPLVSMRDSGDATEPADCEEGESCGTSPGSPGQLPENSAAIPAPVLSPAGVAVEQTSQGQRPFLPVLESFDGLGAGFEGPKGTAIFSNPSDNSLAVGPNHIVQIVNSRLAAYTKKGARYQQSGTVLFGAVATNTLFAGFGGVCQARNNGDAVVRYDQLARRWLFVMPIFSPIFPGEFHGSGELPELGPACGARAGCRVTAQPSSTSASRPETSFKSLRAERDFRDVLRRQHHGRPAGPTIGMPFNEPYFPTIPGRQSGLTATTFQPAPATPSSRNMFASRTVPGCWPASRLPSSAL